MMIETIDECNSLKFEHGPCVKLFPSHSPCGAVYHSLSNSLIYTEDAGLRCLDFQSFLQLIEGQEEVSIDDISKDVLGDYLEIPSTPTALRLSPDEARLAIATDDSKIYAVQIGSAGNLDDLISIDIPQNQTLIDFQWSLSGELLCCLSKGSTMVILFDEPASWSAPIVKEHAIFGFARRVAVVGSSPLVEDGTVTLVNTAIIATQEPTQLLVGSPSIYSDGEFHPLDVTELEGSLSELYNMDDISLDGFSIRGLRSVNENGTEWSIALVGSDDDSNIEFPDVVIAIIQLDDSLTRIDSVLGLAFNEVQWDTIDPHDQLSSLPMLYWNSLSTLIVGSPKAPDVAVISSDSRIVGHDNADELHVIRSPETHQLNCNQIDFDISLGCSNLIFIPRYKGTIVKSHAPSDAPPLIDPSVVLITQTDGRVSIHYVDCPAVPHFPPIRLAPPTSQFPAFSVLPESAASDICVEESGELLSSPSSGSSVTSEGFVAVRSPQREEPSPSEADYEDGVVSEQESVDEVEQLSPSADVSQPVDAPARELLPAADLQSLGIFVAPQPVESAVKPSDEPFAPESLLPPLFSAPTAEKIDSSIQTQKIDGVPKSVQTAPIERPVLTVEGSSSVIIQGVEVVDQSTQSDEQLKEVEREWSEVGFTQLTEWTEDQRQDFKETIGKLRTEIKSNRPPYSEIGGALVEGLSAFETVVQNLEELCLKSVPAELRDAPPLDEDGEISTIWRMRLAPGLNNLQQKSINTKEAFDQFATKQWKPFLENFSDLPTAFQELEELHIVIKQLTKEMLRLTLDVTSGSDIDPMAATTAIPIPPTPTSSTAFVSVASSVTSSMSYREKLDQLLDDLLTMGQVTKQLGHLLNKEAFKKSTTFTVHQQINEAVERSVDQICRALSVLDDAESISRLVGRSIPTQRSRPSIKRKSYSSSVSSPVERTRSPGQYSTPSQSNRPRYGLNYDDLDEVDVSPEHNYKKTDVVTKEETPKKQSGLRIMLSLSSDEEDGDQEDKEESRVEDKKTDIEPERKKHDGLDEATYERLEAFHEKIKSLRNLTKDIRTQYRKAGRQSNVNRQSFNDWGNRSSIYPSLPLSQRPSSSSSIKSLLPTEPHIASSTASLHQIVEYLQTPHLPKRLPISSQQHVQSLQPHLRQTEVQDDLLRHHNSRLLLRYVQRTIQTSRQLQAIAERSSEQQQNRGGIIAGKLGPSLSRRRQELREFTAARRQQRRAEKESIESQRIAFGCLESTRAKPFKRKTPSATERKPVVAERRPEVKLEVKVQPTVKPSAFIPAPTKEAPKPTISLFGKTEASKPSSETQSATEKKRPAIELKPTAESKTQPPLPPRPSPKIPPIVIKTERKPSPSVSFTPIDTPPSSRSLQKRGSVDIDQDEENTSARKKSVSTEGSPIVTLGGNAAKRPTLSAVELPSQPSIFSALLDNSKKAAVTTTPPEAKSLFGSTSLSSGFTTPSVKSPPQEKKQETPSAPEISLFANSKPPSASSSTSTSLFGTPQISKPATASLFGPPSSLTSTSAAPVITPTQISSTATASKPSSLTASTGPLPNSPFGDTPSFGMTGPSTTSFPSSSTSTSVTTPPTTSAPQTSSVFNNSSLFKPDETKKPSTLGSAGFLTGSSLFGQPSTQSSSSSGLFGQSPFERKQYTFGSSFGSTGDQFGSASSPTPVQQPLQQETSSAPGWGSGFASFAAPSSGGGLSMAERAQKFSSSTGMFGQSSSSPPSIFGSATPASGTNIFGNSSAPPSSTNIFGNPSSGFGQPFGSSAGPSTGLSAAPPKSTAGQFRIPNKMD